MSLIQHDTVHDHARTFMRADASDLPDHNHRAVLVVRPLAQELTVVVQDDIGRDRAKVILSEDGQVTLVDDSRLRDSITVAMTLEVDVHDQDAEEIMQEAFSGAINYWADEGEERPTGAWEIYDRTTTTRHEVTSADVRRALRAIASARYAEVGTSDTVHADVLYLLQHSADGIDNALLDSAAADQIVQVAALGRVLHA